MGRFINQDCYVSTGTGMLGYNMFAYCGNNPINRVDHTGMFWKEIGTFFSRAWNEIETWAKNIFGAGCSVTSTIHEVETPIISSLLPISLTTGTKTTRTIRQYGDTTKPISLYGNIDTDDYLASTSGGVKLNFSDFTADTSFALDEISISGSLSNGNASNSFGLKVKMFEFKVGFEYAETIQGHDISETVYTNCSVSALWLMAAYEVVTTGQFSQTSSVFNRKVGATS